MICRACEIAGYLAEDGWANGARMWHQRCRDHGCECGCDHGRRVREPHFGHTRLGHAVHARTLDHLPAHSAYARLNKAVAVKTTTWVGSMTCAYLFSLVALVSLPAVLTLAFHLHVFPSWLVSAGLIALVAWVAQTYIQLVLLSVIMVGQNVQQQASDARAAKTFDDTEMILTLLDLHTEGGLAVLLSEVKDAKAAAETSAEAMKMLTSILTPKTPMAKKASRKPWEGGTSLG